MTPERWDRIKGVLATALELAPGRRSLYLEQQCIDDHLLRGEIEVLLRGEEQVDSQFLGAREFARTAAALLPAEDNPWIGRRVGSYQIVEQIGAGGMGEVYRAFRADDQYRKEVALKVVRAGQDSKFVVARFKNERQVLASLDHSNIARLLDGGSTDDGLPYFVMELIEGQPLNEYCDSHKLPITERLALFLQVCSAVQYAHQHLIIHRDLKPSNILVTTEGTPKLLDFGIAKIVDSDSASQISEPTISMFRLLTPSYASPEQIRGETITTASDVYSLGVLLYELLTGHRPYRTGGRTSHEISIAVCELEPQKPSAVLWRRSEGDGAAVITAESVSALRDGSGQKLSRRLRGDLDNIVLMALRKEPHRRYASVEQFAADLSRHLENLPVSASRGTSRYRASKFIIRHKAGVAAAAAITVTLMLGLAVTFHEARIAQAERARAEQRFKDMRELARSNLFEFHDAIQNLPGSSQARNLVIQRALGYLDKLSRDKAEDRGLMHELAAGYERVADLQDNFSGPGIGDVGASVASYAKAMAIRESLAASSGNDVNELKAECELLDGYLIALQESGRTGEASRIAHRGLEIAQLISQKQPGGREAIMDEIKAHLNLGLVMGGNGSSASTRELPEAIGHDREAIKLLTELPREDGNAFVRAVVRTNWSLANHLRKNREFEESLKIYNSLWSMTQGLRALPVPAQILLYNSRFRLFDDMDKNRHAFDDERKALALARSMVQADPHDLTAQINVALLQGSLGVDEARLGNKVTGMKKLNEAMGAGERLLSANQHELFYQNLLVIGHAYQGEILSSMGMAEQAQAKYSQALKMATDLARNDPEDLESRLNIAKLHVDLGVVLARAKRYPEAQQELGAGLADLHEFLSLRPHDGDALYVSETSRDSLAALQACTARRACEAARTMRLPILNN